MRLLLTVDDTIILHDGLYYAKNDERDEFYRRYLRVFEDVTIVCRCREEETLGEGRILLPESIQIIGVPSYSGPVEYAKKYFSIGRTLRGVTRDCDAAILRLPSTVGQRVGHMVLKRKLPYAVEVVADAHDFCLAAHSVFHKFLWLIIDCQQRYFCHHADGVSCVTESYLQHRYYTKRENGFTGSYSSLSLLDSFYSHAREYPHRPLRICHVANQVSCDNRKGHKELIDAVSVLNERGQFPEVYIVGSDYHGGINSLKKYINEKKVRSKVVFSGYLSRSGLSEMLDQTDVFVFPTNAEGLPRVVIEAMAKGLPCVSHRVSGVPELIEDRFLTKIGDSTGIADRVQHLIEDPALYESTSRRNFEKSKEYRADLLQPRRDCFYKQLKARI